MGATLIASSTAEVSICCKAALDCLDSLDPTMILFEFDLLLAMDIEYVVGVFPSDTCFLFLSSLSF